MALSPFQNKERRGRENGWGEKKNYIQKRNKINSIENLDPHKFLLTTSLKLNPFLHLPKLYKANDIKQNKQQIYTLFSLTYTANRWYASAFEHSQL